MNIYAFRGSRLPYARPYWNANTQEVVDDKFLYGSTVWMFHDDELRDVPLRNAASATVVTIDIVRHADVVVVVNRVKRTQRVIKNRAGKEFETTSSRLTIKFQELWCRLRAREIDPSDRYPYNTSHALAYAKTLYLELLHKSSKETTS